MSPLELAVVIQWAGTLRTRKRMQKVVYLLSRRGFPVQADYVLHRFGPYSADVARLTDQMVSSGLLVEETQSNAVGNQYCYTLSQAATDQLQKLTSNPRLQELSAFESAARELTNADLKELEIGSTIAYFHASGKNWEDAVQSAAQFKKVAPTGQLMTNALAIARKGQ